MTTDNLTGATYTVSVDQHRMLRSTTDYFLWAKLAEHVLKAEGYWDDVSKPKMSSETTNPSDPANLKRLQATMALSKLIDMPVSTKLLGVNPHGLWMSIRKTFEDHLNAAPDAKRARLLRPFNSACDDPVSRIIEHLAWRIGAKHLKQPAQCKEETGFLLKVLRNDPRFSLLVAKTDVSIGKVDVQTFLQTAHIAKQVSLAELRKNDGTGTFSLAEVRNGPDWPLWNKAIEAELSDMYAAGVWEFARRNTVRRTISLSVDLKSEKDANGNITRAARLMARGSEQLEGVDYDETYGPVVSHKTVLTLLTVATRNRMHIHHISFESAFFSVHLREDIYVEPVPGLDQNIPKGCVYKLRKSIYGLRQSSHNWWMRLSAIIIEMGWEQAECGRCLFYRGNSDGVREYIIVYAEDIYIASRNPQSLEAITKKFAKWCRIKKSGPANTILGMRIHHDRDARIMYLDQESLIYKYIAAYLAPDEQRPAEFLVGPGGESPPSKNGTLMHKNDYQARIGALQHLASHTRPDISFEVGRLARRTHCFNEGDCAALQGVFQYLMHTAMDRFKIDGTQGLYIETFADAKWNGGKRGRNSIEGNIMFLGKTPILWNSKLQSAQVFNNFEALLRSVVNVCREANWLRSLVEEMLPNTSVSRPELHSGSPHWKNYGYHNLSHEATSETHDELDFLFEQIETETVKNWLADQLNPAYNLVNTIRHCDLDEQRKKLGVHRAEVRVEYCDEWKRILADLQ